MAATFSSLDALFQPGAVNTDPDRVDRRNECDQSGHTFRAMASLTINGNRAQANNYTLDGIDINEGPE